MMADQRPLYTAGSERADYAPEVRPGASGALISNVDKGSPAWREGIRPGMTITSVNGMPLRDLIDWEWEGDGSTLELEGYVGDDLASQFDEEEGFEFECTLEREIGESWGISFTDCIFDEMRECRNACIFCFMSMLPESARETLTIRDDDYRLSFLQGNFVTLTNMEEEDIQRVIDLHLSPLHVSLHAVTPEVRRRIIGKNAAWGMEVLERLLDAGIEFYAQIVAMPGINDGEELEKTLGWIQDHPLITSVSIVPLGYTRFQRRFDSGYEIADRAAALIDLVEPYREWSREQTGRTRFQVADEFYLFAGRPFPPLDTYDDLEQYEDGIGMVPLFLTEAAAVDRGPIVSARVKREETLGQSVDASHGKRGLGMADPDEETLSYAPYRYRHAAFFTGVAFAPYLADAISQWQVDGFFDVVAVENRYFGGNVDVTGLLTAKDMARSINEWAQSRKAEGTDGLIALVPDVIFNSEGRTLDDLTERDLSERVSVPVEVVSCEVGDIAKLVTRLLIEGDS